MPHERRRVVIRDFERLSGGVFDLLVIGGGIYGAWVAYDAASRGMRVAIIEQKDWAAGTSSASSKLIHGGLRYLEQLRFGLVGRALRERGRLLRLAPHRVQPVRFLVPVYSDSRVSSRRLRMGLWLYDRLAGRRRRVEPSRRWDPQALRRGYGFLEASELQCGFTISDGQTDDARLTLELVAGAVRMGAVAVNRARATELFVHGSSVTGARVVDTETSDAISVKATVIANCTGPWSQSLVETARPSSPRLLRASKGVHLVLPALPSTDGLLLLSRQHGGVVFLIPWYGKTLVGTTDTDFKGSPDDLRVELPEVDYLLAQANRVLAGSPWSHEDVISSFAGLRALPARGDDSPSAVSRELTIEEPVSRLITPIGGKITSARFDASTLVDQVAARLGRRLGRCSTGARPFPWAPPGSYRRWVRDTLARGLELGLDESTVGACQQRYGKTIHRLYRILEDSPELSVRIEPETPSCLAEVVHAVDHEMARSLEDVVRRRVPLLLVSRPTQVALFQIADLMGSRLNWTDERKHSEVTTVFRKPGAGPADQPVF
jgi:glycerol-3-phosphate dehydrogenase